MTATIPKTTRERLYAERPHRCYLCGIPLAHVNWPGTVRPCGPGGWTPIDGHEFVQIDHINPRARGGSNKPENLALCCGPCNSKKGART